jgi:hypothetical protein
MVVFYTKQKSISKQFAPLAARAVFVCANLRFCSKKPFWQNLHYFSCKAGLNDIFLHFDLIFL